jgi:hypothetical protein
MVEAGAERRLVAEVAREAQHLHAAVAVGQALEDRGSPVVAAVVDEEDLGVAGKRVEHRRSRS